MNLNRIDVFIIATLLLHLQLLLEFMRMIGFGVFRALGEEFSFVPAITSAVFAIGVVFSLQGIKVAVNSYFTESEEERQRGARGAGIGLMLGGFMLATLVVLTRTFAYS